MSEIITGKDVVFASWAASKIPQIGKVENFGKYVAVGVMTGKTREDRLQAAVVFHDYYPQYGHCQCSVAAADPRWVSKRNIRALLSIPFFQYQCHTVWVSVLSTNERVVSFAKALGFKYHTTLPDYFGKSKHAVVCRMSVGFYEHKYWGDKPEQSKAA